MSAAHVKLTLHPLPDCLSFLSGHVGLEPAFLRGIVRLEYATSSRFSLFANPLPLHIKQLLIVLTCRQTASFLYRYDLELTRRERLLWRDECLLLHSGETVHAGTLLEIPFEIAIPEPVDLVPVIPPSFQIQNYESMSQTYECMSLVELEAQLHQAPFNDQQQQIQQEQYYLFSSPPNPFVKTTKATISPFVVYDPRLIPKMILPDTKNWRSAPATEPCEYDFEIYNACVGPGDDLTFSYRIAISPISASRGVRIKCVKFIFKENHLIGDIRGTHVRATKELMRWEHHYENNGNKKKRRKQQQTITSLPVHHPTLSRNSSSSASALLTGNTSSHQQGTSSHNAANNDIPPNTTTRTTSPATPPRLIESKSAILSHRSNAMTRNTSSDFSNIDTSGLYAEAEASLRLPLTTTNSNNNNSVVVAPSIPRPSSDPVPMFPGQPAAVIEIKHVLRVDIEFENSILGNPVPDRLAFECGISVASVGRRECMRMLDECPEMVPTVDYDRVAGNEVWIPEYQRWWALFGVMGLPPDYSSVFGGLPEEGDDYDGEEEDNVVEVVQEEESNVNGSDVGRIPHGLGVVTGSVRVVPEEDQPSAHSDSSSIASPVFFAVKNRKDKGKQRAVASSSPSPPRPPPAIPPTSSTSHPQLPAVVDVLERGNVDEEVLFGPPTVPEQPHFILRQTSSSEDVFESADEEYHE